jgi:uncharacterized protein (DUF1684 family)
MKKIFLLSFLILGSNILFAQNYTSTINTFRKNYKKEFLLDKRSPLKKEDLSFLRFYKPNLLYKVKSTVEPIKDTIGFDMLTHSGVIKKYFVYAKLTFYFKQQQYTLNLYQSKDLMSKEGFDDYLFLPFTDKTNYTETFGGGRYIDIKIGDIKGNYLEIDFNKAYNPYCAFKGGYNCPIPPKENALNIAVRAGEKLYGKQVAE